jgi:arylsulfatase
MEHNSASDKVSRTILPIPDDQYVGLTAYDAKDPDNSYPPIRDLRPPQGAPNVIIFLIDDVGFGASSAFGGVINTPAAERLASEGLKYNRFHTTALCSPTRAALLSGRNHHSVNMGGITEMATSAPGYTSVRPRNRAPLAETLKLNGYSTAHFGKCHEVPIWETSPIGPFDRWPTGNGFEYFYGFIGGEANQFYPTLYEGTTPVEVEKLPEEGYHLTDDLADHAIKWVRQQKVLAPDKPFFIYFAPGATHAPHHVPADWIDKYKGQFDDGWDALRERIFARQKELGVIPADAELTARHAEIPAWEETDEAMRPVLARQMEIYAAFLEHTDYNVGRVVETLAEMEILDDTLIFYIIGDNGASAEGSLQGCFNEIAMLNGMGGLESVEFMREHIHDFGTPKSYNHYAVGWAHALCTPYQWTKQVASHFGGTRNGTIVHWPAHIQARGELRTQFAHVIDVAPTVLEAAGIPHPTIVNSIMQAPIEGKSLVYSFDDADAPETHDLQYFEMFCNRGIYHKGWTAVTKHRTPWETGAAVMPSFDEDVWELYDTNKDWTQARDLSKEMPEKLAELQRLWLIEAVKYGVLPLNDLFAERINPELAGRPQLIKGKKQLLYGGIGRLSEGSVLTMKNKSYSITASVQIPDDGAHGVIVAQGGFEAGWSLYAMSSGKLRFCYNFMGITYTYVESAEPLPAGDHQVRLEFAYDGGGLAKGGNFSLYVDGKKVGEERIEMTVPMGFSADETLDVGYEGGAPVSPDYGPRDNRFNGEVEWVQLDIGDDDHDHLISPEERFRVAMVRQ